MCYSKCLVSRKGAIWVAAYCFKRLKKSQVKETDISSSVDKILQDEMNFESYRVLSYLLLGAVRIYSKKVEYLYHDCNEVLIKIKKYMINTENNPNKETLRMSITLPDRFELDAFDLEILEDVGERNIAPKDEITLKDALWKDEGIKQFSLYKYQYEEFDFGLNTCSADSLMLEDVQQSELMDNFEVSPPNSPINLKVGKEKFHDRLFSREEPMNFDSIFGVEGVPTEPIELFIQDQPIDEEQTVVETAPYEDEIHEESLEKIILCAISQEEHEGIRMFTRRDEEPVICVSVSHQVGKEYIKAGETANSECQIHQEIGEVHAARISPASMEGLQDGTCDKKECLDYDRSPIDKQKIEKFMVGSVEKDHDAGKLKLLDEVSNEDAKFGEEQIKVKETTNSECQMHQEIEEVHEARNSPVSMEMLQDDIFNKKDCLDPVRSSSAKEKSENLIEGSIEKHHNKARLKLQGEVSVENNKFHLIPPESNSLDITAQTKFPDDSVAKPKQGATMPESIHISTPAVKERARFSRKRKCAFDGLIILPNEVLRQSIHDTSDLISKRTKVPHPVLAAWKASRISSLPEAFHESLLPCHSLDLQILFSKKKIKISKSIEIVATPGNLDKSESQTGGRLELSEPAPNTPPQFSKTGSIDYQESIKTQKSDNGRPSSPHACPEREKRLKQDGELHLMKEGRLVLNEPAPNTPPQSSKTRPIDSQESTKTQKSDNGRPSSPHVCMEGERHLKKDGELHLMKEGNVETSSSHTSITGEQCLRKDEELDLMNEETNSIETENADLCGWSGRTTKVARYLHGQYRDLRKQREEEVVNFSQVLVGRDKKECAMLFYEILVLRTTSCLDVKQNNAYGDISIWKLPKLDQSFGVDGL